MGYNIPLRIKNLVKRTDETVPERIAKALGIHVRYVDTLSLIHISEPTRRRGISYAVFCLKKKKK